MKSKICILFLFCLAAPIVVTFTIPGYQKGKVRLEVKQQIADGMDDEELVLLKFPEIELKKQLQWEDPGEFEYRGQMYDVVKKEIHGDSVYIWCWWDHKETRLQKQMDALVADALGNDRQKKENQKRLVIFYKSLYCSDNQDQMLFTRQTGRIAAPFRINYQTIAHSPLVPPPESGLSNIFQIS